MAEGIPELSGSQIATETGHGLEQQPGARTDETQKEPVTTSRQLGRRGRLLGVATLIATSLVGFKPTEKPQEETK
jgi:hypothetical protein